LFRHCSYSSFPGKSQDGDAGKIAHRTEAADCEPLRASRTISKYWRAAFVISWNFPDLMAVGETSSPPTPTAAAPASMKLPAVSRLTPPVGIIKIWGKGPFNARMYLGPPTGPQGKIFTKSLPDLHALTTSVGVSAPAIINLPARFAAFTVPSSKLGLTINCAPASMHFSAVSASRTVPAPRSRVEPAGLARSEITSMAPGTVIG